jgi:hypothetical protein
MPPIEIKWHPSRGELRTFTLVWFPAFCAVVAWILWSRVGRTPAIAVLATGAALVAVGLVVPAVMRGVFVGLSVVTFPIGFVISHVVLAVVYFVVLTPIALIARAFGHDPRRRRATSRAASYWIDRPAPRDKADYFKQF